ncbi:MAG TPA: protein kinase, partial [Planctomycetota bacterium]|nr:protein kinase [Planctomycetota bacterium]
NDAGIIQIFGTGIWRGRFFYAMELVSGEDLATRLEKRGRCTPAEALTIAEGVARALKAMWKYHIVHRDIKPSNILITPEGAVKVADLGLAKRVAMLRTDTQVVVGTSEYLSPEQGLGRTVDVRADIYSLGVVLYEALTGRPPFRSEGSFSCVVYQHVHVTPPQVARLAPDVPPPLQRLIERCLAKNPDDRFPSPEALLDEIELVRGGRGSAVRFRLPRLGRRTWISAAAGVVLAIAAAAAWTLSGGGRRDGDFARAYDVAWVLGDYAQAMRLAERHAGARSPEYRRAAERVRGSSLRDLREALRRAASTGDWAAAERACQAMAESAPAEELAALETTARACAELARAGELEKAGRPAEALRIYRLYEGPDHPFSAEVRTAVRRLEGAALQGSPEPPVSR